MNLSRDTLIDPCQLPKNMVGKQLGSESFQFSKENVYIHTYVCPRVCMSVCLFVCLPVCPTKWGIPPNLSPCHNLEYPPFWTNLSLFLSCNVVDPIVASFWWICNWDVLSIKTQMIERYIHTSLHKQKIKHNQTFHPLPWTGTQPQHLLASWWYWLLLECCRGLYSQAGFPYRPIGHRIIGL